MTHLTEFSIAAPLAHPAPFERFGRLDALRGLALVWMTAYHFAFDLNWFGIIRQDFYRDPRWIAQRTVILSLFLIAAGMGQAIAQAQGQTWPRFWRRWAHIALAAALVSIGSWWVFPGSWISFGVLHGMALMLPLTRALLDARGARWPWALALLGALLIAAAPLGCGWLVQADAPTLAAWLDSRWLYGIGWITHKPRTEDYVPLLPWWGVMLIGAALALWLLRGPSARTLLTGPAPRFLRGLAALGRWSLLYYLLHQPVLIGALTLWQWLR
ncbi:MAG: DUF1624 domain-containing protein [Burkholderiaceae bacterium]|jgi:uncharacterized membrane protein|nr:DUF1624 domain-containing protein [Burkholderiaceae bacterium]